MKRFRKYNTLRNQILAVFLIAMLVVLSIVSYLIFNQVASMLKDNAREQIRQTAIESVGRYDSLFEQLNLVTKQIMTNDTVQALMLEEANNGAISFSEKQELISITSRIQANADGIYRVDLYGPNLSNIIPLDGPNLNGQVPVDTISQVEEARGRLVWVGVDPNDDNYFLLMRRISLLNDNFSNGGYMLIRVMRPYFEPINQGMNQLTVVRDQFGALIATNHQNDQMSLEELREEAASQGEYIEINQTSRATGFTVSVFTPVEHLTEGLPVLRTIILIAGSVGIVVFFIFSFGLSTYITKPINRLTETMRKAHEGVLTLTPESVASNEINELNDTYNQLVEHTNYLIQMVYEKELIKSQTELKALQAQINPHFLFNTLNALYWSLDEKEEDELSDMVLAMSDLFRYTITKSKDDEWVMLRDEINHLKDYMTIMKMRFGEHINLILDVDHDLETVRIPKLLIQPFVENAILHGLTEQEAAGVVKLTIAANSAHGERVVPTDADLISIEICDNGKGMQEKDLAKLHQSLAEESKITTKGAGMALANIKKRLALYYGKTYADQLVFTSEPNVGTTVRFTIPYKEEMS